MTLHGKTPDEPGSRRQANAPHVPAQQSAEENQRLAQENWRELHGDPYYLLPDEYLPWLIGRAKYHIVVDQRRDWQSDGPPSLAELLENLARTREPEPDLEAEP